MKPSCRISRGAGHPDGLNGRSKCLSVRLDRQGRSAGNQPVRNCRSPDQPSVPPGRSPLRCNPRCGTCMYYGSCNVGGLFDVAVCRRWLQRLPPTCGTNAAHSSSLEAIMTDAPGAANTPTPGTASPAPTVLPASPGQAPPPTDARGAVAGVRNRWTCWENCGSAVVLIGIVPLLPVLLELLLKNEISVDSLTITAAIYAVTIAVASKYRLLFVLGFVVALLECALYGQDVTVARVTHPASANIIGLNIFSDGASPPSHAGLVLLAIAFLFTCLVVERFLRHVILRKEFFEFIKRD